MKNIIAKLQPIISLTLLYCFALLLCLGNLQKITMGSSSVYGHDIVIAVFLLISLVFRGITFFQHLKSNLIAVSKCFPFIALALTYVALVTSMQAIQVGDITPILYITRLIGYALFVFAVSLTLNHFQRGFLWLGCVIGFLYLGLLQYVFLPDTRILAILGYDDHYYRLIGTLFDPNFTGIIFVLGLLSILQRKLNLTVMAVAIALTIGVVLTYSRSTWLAVLIGGFYILIHHVVRNKQLVILKMTVFLVITALVTFLLAPKPGGEGVTILRTSTINARYVAATNIINQWNPLSILLGEGLFQQSSQNSFIPYHPRVPDNSILLLIQGGGVGVVLAFGYTLAQYFWKGTDTHNKTLLLTFMVHSLFSASLIQPAVFLVFWGLISTSEQDEKSKH